jgi:hypothetical protein
MYWVETTSDTPKKRKKLDTLLYQHEDVDDDSNKGESYHGLCLYYGVVGADMPISGSGKLKLASIVKAAVGENVELIPNIPKLPKPVGVGSPKGMANFGDKGRGAGNCHGM